MQRLYLFFALFKLMVETEGAVDPSKSVIWGPGLKPTQIILPARYFFVQLYDTNGKMLTESPGKGLEAYIGGSKATDCRIWVNILDRKDGSFIIRYKLYHSCDSMKIDVRFNNLPIKGTPLFFKQVLSDDCICATNLNTWLRNMECKGSYTQIDMDLSNFKAINFSDIKNNIIETYNKPNSVSLCHYVLKKNEVYRTCYGQYIGFKMFMDSILLSLTRKVQLPDIEFFVNLGDWPLVRRTQFPIPIFSWCGSEDSLDIVMPTYDITEATLECMGRVLLDMLSVQGNTGPVWSKKTEKGFWRGRDARQERLDLIDLARKYPNHINASLTNFFFFRDQEDQYGPKEPHISFFDFFQYKYQINIDGTVAAYRLPYLLAGDSVILKQDSPYYEHFYHDLIPGVHYIPFKRDLSDLIEKINWLREHDTEAKEVSERGQRFARENLMPADIFCYYTVLFKEWSTHLISLPEILPTMEHVPQPQPDATCSCHETEFLKHEEL